VGEPKKAIELKKHVAVIHSSNRLSLLQRKIANALLFNAYHHLLDKDEHEIHIATLCQLIGYASNDYKTIKKSLVNLLATVLEWNLVDGERPDGEGVWTASSIIADASIDGPVCTYSYSNKMRQLLHRPNMYGRLDMLVQAKFQSGYGLALYENCNRFQDIGQTPWFDIDKFRKLMGVEDGKYKVFRDFKSRVLDKAIQEVNEYSSLKLEAQLRRQNQKVVAIQFVIQKIDVLQIAIDQPQQAKELIEVLKQQFGFSKTQIQQTLENYAEGFIREKIKVIEDSQSYLSGKIKNLAKYLLSALQEDYQPVKKRKKIEKSVSTQSNLVEFNEHTRQKKEREHQYQRFVQKEVMIIYNQMPEIEQKLLLMKFEEFVYKAARGIYGDIYFRDGIKNPLIQDQFYEFVKRFRQDLLSGIMSFDDWMLK